MDDQETNFLRALSELQDKQGHMRLNYLQYHQIISDLKIIALKSTSKTNREYYLLRQYEIYDCGRSEKLIKKRKTETCPVLYVVPLEQHVPCTASLKKASEIGLGKEVIHKRR